MSEKLERRFWRKVWRCTHRDTCKRCCWPWKSVDLSINVDRIWKMHPIYYDRERHTPVMASRFAYEVSRGKLVFSGRRRPVCHECHFAPCCNFAHLALGSVSDNVYATAGARGYQRPSICLPDGRIWHYRDAWLRGFPEAYPNVLRHWKTQGWPWHIQRMATFAGVTLEELGQLEPPPLPPPPTARELEIQALLLEKFATAQQ